MDIMECNTIYCWNIIDYGFSERIIHSIADNPALSDKNGNKHITLLINSKGGSLSDVWAIIDFMNELKLKQETIFTTIGIGSIESAALLLFLAGTKGHRYIYKHCHCMCHPYTWYTHESQAMKYTSLKNRRPIEDSLNKQLEEYYIKNTKLTKKNVDEFLSGEDKFFDAQTAVEYGFADKII